MTPYVAVHGTWSGAWGKKPEEYWWWRGPWMRYMLLQEFAPARADDPYRWSGDVNGVAGVLHRFLGRPPAQPTDWLAAGDSFRWYCAGLSGPLIVFAHSHGMNPVIIAAAHETRPIRIRTLVTIGSPVRADMLEVAKAARPNIGFWLHLYDSKFDDWGSFGQFGDGQIEWWWSPSSRMHPCADMNVAVEDIGHSGLLYEESQFFLWTTRGWLDLIARGAAV